MTIAEDAPASTTVLHPVYLPFDPNTLLQHFADVGRPSAAAHADRRRHLKYYEASAKLASAHRELHQRAGNEGKLPGCNALNHQVEKDERFWIVAALMAAFHAQDRVQALTALLTSSLGPIPPVEGLGTWADALAADDANPLRLFFEVNLPSPLAYRTWLQSNVATQALTPITRATAVGMQQEGATKADAMLIAPKTGFAVVFEAKVLSDASSHTQRDATRNQIARNIDVLLEENPRLQKPLTSRQPQRTCFVLVTPELFMLNPSTRLYGHLMGAYRQDTVLLQQHLPHRTPEQLTGVPARLGWTTFEEINCIVPGACAWLPGA